MIRCPALQSPVPLTKVSEDVKGDRNGVRGKRGLAVCLQPNTGVIIMLSTV